MTERRARFDIRASARQILAVFVGVLVLNVVGYAVFVRPTIGEYQRLMAESEPRRLHVRQRKSEVEKRKEYVAALDTAGKQLEQLRANVLSTKRRRMIDVQDELARLAGQFGINMQRIQYDNEPLEDEGLERFVMVVPLEGGYSALRRFLQAVESSGEFLVIEQVALAGKEGSGELLQLNITLATYFDAPELKKRKDRPRALREGA